MNIISVFKQKKERNLNLVNNNKLKVRMEIGMQDGHKEMKMINWMKVME